MWVALALEIESFGLDVILELELASLSGL